MTVEPSMAVEWVIPFEILLLSGLRLFYIRSGSLLKAEFEPPTICDNATKRQSDKWKIQISVLRLERGLKIQLSLIWGPKDKMCRSLDVLLGHNYFQGFKVQVQKVQKSFGERQS